MSQESAGKTVPVHDNNNSCVDMNSSCMDSTMGDSDDERDGHETMFLEEYRECQSRKCIFGRMSNEMDREIYECTKCKYTAMCVPCYNTTNFRHKRLMKLKIV